MPFALLIIGLFLLISGVRNTSSTLFGLIHGDFTGQDNFIYWFLAILLIGALGYVPKLKPISTGFLVLVLVVLFLKKGKASGVGGGFFTQFTSAIGTSTYSSVAPTSNTTALGTPIGTTAAQQASITQELQMQLQGLLP